MRGDERDVRWLGDSRITLRGFPAGIRWVFGRALFKAQLGKKHQIASPMKGRLSGVVKLAEHEKGESYRLYYTLKCPGHVDVLFAHQKKSKRGIGLPKHEEDLIVRRFRARVADCDDEREEKG